MLSSSTVIILRLVHIIVGVSWVGAVVFIATMLLPTIRAVGPAAGPVMQHLAEVRKVSVYLLSGAVITILSGLGLYWNDSADFTSAWLSSGPGRTFGLGAALAIITAIIGMAVNSPSAARLGKIGAAVRASGGPPSAEQAAEMQRLQKRLGIATSVAAVLLLLATATMAVARYMPS